MTIIHWLVSAVAIALAAYIIPGVSVTPLAALVVAVVLGVINVFIKPVVLLLTLPLTIVTLGIWSFIINVLFILLAAKIVPGFSVDGFWIAALFSIVLALINALLVRPAKTVITPLN